MTKKKDSFTQLFHLTFIGEYVQLTTNMFTIVNEENDEVLTSHKVPVTIDGYILDIDEDYYYLGTTPHEINKAIKKDVVIFIGIVENKNVYDEILDSLQEPEDVN